MKKKIVIAAATGFIGKFLKKKYEELGYEVLVISRSAPHILWTDEQGIIEVLEGAEIVINLAGKSVDCRYTEENKNEILNSRVRTTQKLGEAILKCQQPPELWINSSTATIYRYAEDRPMTETHGELGNDFSPSVAKAWEKTFFDFSLPKTRQIALRIAITLGDDGGALGVLSKLTRFGLGGIQGSGKQMVSWVHVADVFRAMVFLQANKAYTGIYNISSPNPVPNKEFMSLLRKALKISIGLPAPKWMIGIGAFFMRTEPELVLKSRWVVPERITRAGFTFKYEQLDQALKEIVKLDE